MSRRAEIRERVEKFLNPDQLSKWDAEVAKAKEFLGQRLDAAQNEERTVWRPSLEERAATQASRWTQTW